VSDPFIKAWMIDRADDHFEMDISKAKEYLNWEPAYDLKSTLPKIIEKLKADPTRWYKDNKLNP
jgi:nucleoside-diphosphate-sugar epimerase